MKLFFQLLFILISFTFIGFFAALRFTPPESAFNQEVRPFLLKSNLTRRLFQLTRLGDGRYLLSSQNPLTINLFYPQAYEPHDDLKIWADAMVQTTTGHIVTINPQPQSDFPQTPLSDDAIDQLLNSLPSQSPTALNLVYLSGSTDAPTNAGQAINANTILMFYGTIQDLSTQSHIRSMLEQSTLMHEWGHILNLGHIDQADCIMNEKVEVYAVRRFQGSNLPTVYCAEELYQLINQIR
jgi:hypothetical protein